jgi:hypothetical protein
MSIADQGSPEFALNANSPMTRADRAETLEEAKAQFQKSWGVWKA